MKVNDFVGEYKKSDESARQELIAAHITRHYVPYLEKVASGKAIVDETQRVKTGDKTGKTGDELDKQDELEGLILSDTPVRYLVTIMQEIAEYTDLEQSVGVAEDYDALQECGSLALLRDAIGTDLNIFDDVVQMVYDDAWTNETNLGRQMSAAIKPLYDDLLSFIEYIAGQLQEITSESASQEEDNDGVS